MFEVQVSDSCCYDFDMLLNALERETQLCGGVFAVQKTNERFRACMAVGERFRNYFVARVKEEICNYIAVEYKYNYFLKTLNLISLNECEKVAFCSSLAVFDKETDKKFIFEHLLFGSEIVIDSAVAFCMQRLYDRWAEIALLIETNRVELSSGDGLVEMMRFLLKSSPYESEKIHLKQLDDKLCVVDDLGNIQFKYEDGEFASEKILHRAISLLPKQIALHGDRFNYLYSLFPNAKKQEIGTIL